LETRTGDSRALSSGGYYRRGDEGVYFVKHLKWGIRLTIMTHLPHIVMDEGAMKRFIKEADDLNPTRGHEEAGKRPGLVVSVDPFNRGPAGPVVILPIYPIKSYRNLPLESFFSILKGV